MSLFGNSAIPSRTLKREEKSRLTGGEEKSRFQHRETFDFTT